MIGVDWGIALAIAVTGVLGLVLLLAVIFTAFAIRRIWNEVWHGFDSAKHVKRRP